MTPAKMFQVFGSDIKCLYQIGDNVSTPNGLGKIKSEFSRGLKWWVETNRGTFQSETINKLNPGN
jgi:hypothetical protein